MACQSLPKAPDPDFRPGWLMRKTTHSLVVELWADKTSGSRIDADPRNGTNTYWERWGPTPRLISAGANGTRDSQGTPFLNGQKKTIWQVPSDGSLAAGTRSAFLGTDHFHVSCEIKRGGEPSKSTSKEGNGDRPGDPTYLVLRPDRP